MPPDYLEITFHPPPPTGVSGIRRLLQQAGEGDDGAVTELSELMRSATAKSLPATLRTEAQEAIDAWQYLRTEPRRLVARGKCVTCWGADPEPGKIRCQYCLDYMKNVNARRRKYFLSKGACPRCGKDKPPDKYACEPCIVKRNLGRSVRHSKKLRKATITRLTSAAGFYGYAYGLKGEAFAAMYTGATVGSAIAAGATARHLARGVVEGYITITLPGGELWTPPGDPNIWRTPDTKRTVKADG